MEAPEKEHEVAIRRHLLKLQFNANRHRPSYGSGIDLRSPGVREVPPCRSVTARFMGLYGSQFEDQRFTMMAGYVAFGWDWPCKLKVALGLEALCDYVIGLLGEPRRIDFRVDQKLPDPKRMVYNPKAGPSPERWQISFNYNLAEPSNPEMPPMEHSPKTEAQHQSAARSMDHAMLIIGTVYHTIRMRPRRLLPFFEPA